MLDEDRDDLAVLGLPERDYERIGDALRYLAAHWEEQPELDDIAANSGLSPYHFQRVFTRWVGLSPKQFLKKLTIEEAKRRLRESASVLDAAYDAGLSGPGRLHDLFISCEAMSPGEFKALGKSLLLRWGFAPGPFGECLLLFCDRGLCGLGFVDERGRAHAFEDLTTRFAGATMLEDQPSAAALAARIFTEPTSRPAAVAEGAPLKLLLKGTRFQLQVWDALMRLPQGSLTTYGGLARQLGMPTGAARAIGSAVGANPISWLIPCHRVIRNTGALGGYHWGLPRKLAMLGWEGNKTERRHAA